MPSDLKEPIPTSPGLVCRHLSKQTFSRAEKIFSRADDIYIHTIRLNILFKHEENFGRPPKILNQMGNELPHSINIKFHMALRCRTREFIAHANSSFRELTGNNDRKSKRHPADFSTSFPSPGHLPR
ncbi:hypothetical protein [Burkholderia sp. MSMB1589WGS]|uniref:hypothetical protein n=1 Tax=Burkholderia sp. MSMB1589WGS TaxID=1636425 RepID=UPI0012E7AB6F|nr:hypothetical protein [Burkholderia sp. MSMB1589WGS]